MKFLLPAAILCVAAAASAQIPVSPGGEPGYRVHIPSADPAGLRGALEASGYDVSCLPSAPAHVEAIVSAAEMQALLNAGLSPAVQDVAAPLTQMLGTGDIPIGYHDLAAITAILQATQAANPTLAQVVDIASVYGPGSTIEGRPILALKISDNVTVDEDEPEVVIASCHHCREIVTPEIALDIIGRLMAGYGSDPLITGMVDSQEIWIIPVQNPDGLAYTWTTNAMWRKNRRPNGDGTFGVDLNRNYPLGWNGCSPGSTATSNETYRGPSAASERETQTMIAFSRARRPAKVLDFHSSGREVLLGYLCTAFPPALDAQIDAGGNALAALIGYGTRQASAEGEHQMFQIRETTNFAYLIETELSFQPAYANAVNEANLVWPAVRSFLAQPVPLTGRITNAQGGAPVAADIAFAGVSFANGETRKSDAAFGRYQLWLPPGAGTLIVSAPGFATKYVPVFLAANVTSAVDIALDPSGTEFRLDFTTSGGGAGNLHLALANLPASGTQGFTLFSLSTGQALGLGNVLGIEADAFTLQALLSPPFAGNPFHFPLPAVPGLYPAAPLDFPNGSLAFAPGTTIDGVGVALTPAWTVAGATAPVRATF